MSKEYQINLKSIRDAIDSNDLCYFLIDSKIYFRRIGIS